MRRRGYQTESSWPTQAARAVLHLGLHQGALHPPLVLRQMLEELPGGAASASASPPSVFCRSSSWAVRPWESSRVTRFTGVQLRSVCPTPTAVTLRILLSERYRTRSFEFQIGTISMELFALIAVAWSSVSVGQLPPPDILKLLISKVRLSAT